MDKQQKLKIALPVLLVVMAVVWGPVILGSNSKDKANNNIQNIDTASSGSINGMDLVALSREGRRKKARTSYADWGRNPFMLEYDSNSIIVEGIFWDEKNPKAILNGNIIGVGDDVGPSTILAITQQSVILKSEDGVIELHLGGE